MVRKKARKIERKLDWFNPKNLKILRDANITYGIAQKWYKEQNWIQAVSAYDMYIEEYVTIDYDAYYELATCHLKLYEKILKEYKERDFLKKPNQKKLFEKRIDEHFKKCLSNLERAKKLRPNSIFLKNRLMEIYLIKKDHRKINSIIKDVEFGKNFDDDERTAFLKKWKREIDI